MFGGSSIPPPYGILAKYAYQLFENILINNLRNSEYIPLKFLCCNQYSCHDCIEEYIRLSNSIICPFCKKNYDRNIFCQKILLYHINYTSIYIGKFKQNS